MASKFILKITAQTLHDIIYLYNEYACFIFKLSYEGVDMNEKTVIRTCTQISLFLKSTMFFDLLVAELFGSSIILGSFHG